MSTEWFWTIIVLGLFFAGYFAAKLENRLK